MPVPDLGGHHVPKPVGDQLSQVTPGGEHAGVGGGADGPVEVGALDAALQSDDEHQPPDHQRRAEDEDAGLAQGFAEEPEHLEPVDRPMIRRQNLLISPKVAIQSLGTASQPMT